MLFPEYGLLPARHDSRVSVVTDVNELPGWHALLKRLSIEGMVCWDTETSGFDYFKDARIIGHCFGFDLGDGAGPRGVYFPIRHATHERQLPAHYVTWMAQDILGDARATVVGHNIKFDMNFGAADGIVVRAKLHDTMIMVALYDENRPKEMEACAYDFGIDHHAYEMKAIVQKILAEECRRRGVKKSNAPGYVWIHPSVLGRYGCKDGYNTLGLAQKLLPIVQRHWPSLYDTEMRLTRVLQRAEFIGTPIDIPYLRGVHAHAEQRANQLEKQIHQATQTRLKLSSDNELRNYLYGHLGYTVRYYTKNGRPDPRGSTPAEIAGIASVDERALKAMIRERPLEMLRDLIAWREQDKILSTYTTPIIEKCDARGYLHTSLNQVRANTGRMSSSAPNLQNIKTPSYDDGDAEAQAINVRRAFLVPPGKTRIYCDFSQVELRVLAFVAKEPTMTAAFVNKEDIHTRTSIELFHSSEKKYRRVAKVVSFGISYGMTSVGIMENLNETADPSKGIDYVTEEQAQGYLDLYHRRYPRVMAFCEELWDGMRRCQGVPTFTNAFGRCRRIPEIRFDGAAGARAQRKAVASRIQGEAADIAKVSMVRVGDRLAEARAAGRYDGEFILNVHDENQVDVDTKYAEECAREMKRDMEYFPQFAPIEITAEAEWSTTTWADKKPIWGKK